MLRKQSQAVCPSETKALATANALWCSECLPLYFCPTTACTQAVQQDDPYGHVNRQRCQRVLTANALWLLECLPLYFCPTTACTEAVQQGDPYRHVNRQRCQTELIDADPFKSGIFAVANGEADMVFWVQFGAVWHCLHNSSLLFTAEPL